ncbi:MAG: c-type cytochrome [Sporocytophaga sp.]|uniref:cytochrome-c peroxidase n=1 Tax=Sporocytophaga sp. TaxID=2231183 RepID=UPI001AFFF9F1|nr:cytochrome c peroxidase [Sporocytophaga sp.]MBO9699296.1 c-type cytochrome [Sporocytophaga sp.]
MRNKQIVFLFSFIIFSTIFLTFLLISDSDAHFSASGTASEKIKVSFISNIDHLIDSINSLKKASAYGTETEISEAFYALRSAYKKTEFLIEYIDPEFTAKNINGANLPKLDNNPLNLVPIAPKGMQVIEEYICSGEALLERDQIKYHCNSLLSDINYFKNYSKDIYFTDRMIFEAIRNETLRIMTLGITGFDSPVCKNSIKEAVGSLISIQEAIDAYKAAQTNQDKNIEQLYNKLSAAVQYLKKNNDFNSFNRLFFIKEFGNPIYKLSLLAHKSLQIETNTVSSPFTPPVNYNAENIFSSDFLNPNFYSKAKITNTSNEIVALGKLLFFDPILSSNNQRACASCHQPEKGFTDGLVKSQALDHEGSVSRNAPTLLNVAFQTSFFHDSRANTLENQIDHVIFNRKEFKTDYETIITRLKNSEEYTSLFNKAFPKYPGSVVDGYTLNKALGDYLRTLNTFNSPFDKYIRGETLSIPLSVVNGFNLFMGKAQCATCHFAPVFNGTVPPGFIDTESEVIGVPISSDTSVKLIDPDLGKYLIRSSEINKNAFKTPTLRNIALTAPYMHNGVYKTLKEVVEFYNRGGGAGSGIKVDNQTLPSDPLGLTEKEINDLVKFMESLTDTTFNKSRPEHLPIIQDNKLNNRVIGGMY